MKINKLSVVILLGVIIVSFSGIGMAEYEDLERIILDDQMYLFIKVGGAEITFDDSTSDIFISEELNVEVDGNDVTVTSPRREGFFNWFKDEHHEIVVGTARDYETVEIDVGGVGITGPLYAEEIHINAGGMSLDTDLYAEEVNVNGAGMNFKGSVHARDLNINGAGMDVDIEVEGTEEISINGAGIDVEIRYLDGWIGYRRISVDGIGGDINVEVPGDNKQKEDGYLDVDTSGVMDVDVDYY